MCGGSDDHTPREPVPAPAPAPAPAPDVVYTAPDLRTNYKNFRDTGTVPYSYYGQGAPSNPDELALVKAAYGGSFAAPVRLMEALRSFGGNSGGPSGASRPMVARRPNMALPPR